MPDPFAIPESLERRLLLDALPDLGVSNLRVTSPHLYAGATITVEYDVTNLGAADAAVPWSDQIVLSKSTKPNPLAEEWVDLNAVGSLAVNATLHVSVQLTLPPAQTGTRYVIVQLDPVNFTLEDNQANNIAVLPITVLAAPVCDLTPTTLSPAGDLAVGQTITLNYHVDNISPNPALNAYFDQISYSRDVRLDSKDLVLYQATHGDPGDPVLAGLAGYDGGPSLTVRSDMLGAGFLILKVTASNEGKNTANNILAVPITVEGTLFTNLTSGQLIVHSQAIPVTLKSYAATAGETLSAWVQNYQPPVLGGGGADPGAVPLLSDLALPQGASLLPAVLDTSALPDGMYDLVLQWQAGGNESYRRTLRVMVVDSVTHVPDKLGDTVGGPDFEVYSMDIGAIGGTMIVHVATNFVDPGPADNGTDGDFRILVGKRSPVTFGLAVDNRTTNDAKGVIAGNLYTGVTFNKGEIVPKYYSQINRLTGVVIGQSWSAKLAGTGGDPWARDIYGGADLVALRVRTAEGVKVSWTMWCGNDEIEASAPLPLVGPGKPVITALTAPGDKNPSPTILGPYLASALPHVVSLTARVTGFPSDPVVAVLFDLPTGQRLIDTNPSGGWSITLDLADLALSGPLTLTAITRAGLSSSPFIVQLQIS
ncbi:MAG: hypothetical protein NTV86_10785 [Planctomycetota bacterium]|nr:hypothetical protein [Planctomycetota bacterium]